MDTNNSRMELLQDSFHFSFLHFSFLSALSFHFNEKKNYCARIDSLERPLFEDDGSFTGCFCKDISYLHCEPRR